METKNKLNYEVTNEEAYVYTFGLSADFIYEGEKYWVKATYVNDGWIEDVEVYDTEEAPICDDAIIEIANEIVENMNINKDTITW